MADCIFGVDLGLGGGISALRVDSDMRVLNPVHARRMPTLPAPKGKGRVYDVPGIALRLSTWEPDHVFIEEAQLKGKRPKQTLQAVAGMARCQALFEMLCHTRGYSCTIVRARTWQTVMFKGLGKVQDTKAASILIATRLFPGVNLIPDGCRKQHDGLSDSLLLAEYGRRQLKGSNDDDQS